MDISKARNLKQGDKVSCPADRGDKPFIGTVVSSNLQDCGSAVDYQMNCYIWVEVLGAGGRKSVWPSTRLTKV